MRKPRGLSLRGEYILKTVLLNVRNQLAAAPHASVHAVLTLRKVGSRAVPGHGQLTWVNILPLSISSICSYQPYPFSALCGFLLKSLKNRLGRCSEDESSLHSRVWSATGEDDGVERRERLKLSNTQLESGLTTLSAGRALSHGDSPSSFPGALQDDGLKAFRTHLAVMMNLE